MTKFADQLFDDLMQDHGSELAAIRMPTTPKRHVARPALLAAGAGGLAAVATAVGLLVTGGSTPGYAVTNNANGTVTLDAYNESGIAGANTALQKMGDRVALVQVRAGCPSITSLPKVSDDGYLPVQMSVTQKSGSSVNLNLQGVQQLVIDGRDIPKGDVILVPVEPDSKGVLVFGQVVATSAKAATLKAGVLTKAPAPSCVSVPKYTDSSPAPTKSSNG
jgi:hypothetical protein